MTSRVFVGIPLGLEIQASLAQCYATLCTDVFNRSDIQLHQQSGHLRNVDPANWHITLAFSGSFPRAHLESLRGQLLSQCEGYGKGEATLSRIQLFPDAKSNIVAALLEPSAWLSLLRVHVLACFQGYGVDVADHGSFRPHITLARLSKGYVFPFPPKAISLPMGINHIVLYQSELGASGPSYQPLVEVQL